MRPSSSSSSSAVRNQQQQQQQQQEERRKPCTCGLVLCCSRAHSLAEGAGYDPLAATTAAAAGGCLVCLPGLLVCNEQHCIADTAQPCQ
jgi:hypothetical protein